MKTTTILCLILMLFWRLGLAQDVPLVITGGIDEITNRANDITFIFLADGRSPAANVGWGTNPPDSFRLTLDLSNSTRFSNYYSVQLFKGVAPAIYTPGPYVRLNGPVGLLLPGGFGYQLQKGTTYRIGLYDVEIIDRPDAATDDIIFKYEAKDNGGTGGGSGGGGGGGGSEIITGGGGGGASSGLEVVPSGIDKSIGLLGLLPVPAIVSGLLPRNVDANPATSHRLLDDLIHAVLTDEAPPEASPAVQGGGKDSKLLSPRSASSQMWLRAFGGNLPGQGGKFYQNDWEGLGGGVALGADLGFSSYGHLGLFGSYGRLDVRHEELGGGHWFPDMVGGGAYLRWDQPGWFAGAAVAAHQFSGEQTRGINYPGIDLTAEGDRTTNALTAAFQGGVRFKAPSGFVFTPSFLADWSAIEEGAFSESGADIPFRGRTFGFSNLEYDERTTHWLSTDLGVTVSRPTSIGRSLLTPSMRVAWKGMWQIGDNAQSIHYRFTGRSLNVDGSWKDQQHLSLGGGLNLRTAGNASFYIQGEALLVGEGSFNASIGMAFQF